jgi:hypothetical protein
MDARGIGCVGTEWIQMAKDGATSGYIDMAVNLLAA